jgi:cytochrome c553
VPTVAIGGGELPSVLLQGRVDSNVAPPPISGGTMLATRDGALLVAADPDRDQLYFLDAKGQKLSHVRALMPGDEPGRVVEDAAGRIHVALRGGHALLTLTRDPDSPITRREICDVPRGLAYDPNGDVLHVACAEGELVTIGAAPDARIQRVLPVERDVRDVIVRGDQLLVSRFHSAELLTLAADGGTAERVSAPTLSRMSTEVVSDGADSGGCFPLTAKEVRIDDTPSVAYRTIDVPGKGVVMLHQRSQTGTEIQTSPGGYSNGSCGAGIVQTAITTGLDGDAVSTVDLTGAVVAVDVASDPEGSLLAVVAPGNWGTGSPQLHIIPLGQLPVMPRSSAGMTPSSKDAPATPAMLPGMIPPGFPGMLPTSAVPTSSPSDPAECFSSQAMPPLEGQATAVAFVSAYVLAVQQREPAVISFVDLRTSEIRASVSLDQTSRFSTGQAMFYARTDAGLACASCHAEGGDDGHVWTFKGIGARRTQSLRGGILGTEPFHWNGDMHDFDQLVHEVFVGRMAGFAPSPAQSDALSHWIDQLPALHAQVSDQSAMRGEELFESAAVGCSGCHAGAHLTDNSNRDVGTGAALQVPSLRGVSFRAPLMHDGCAATLADRFGPCGGGDQHGHTSQLSDGQRSDLIAYLETL